MIICDVPKIFQPNYKSDYPSYSSGRNMEEICYEYFSLFKHNIVSDYIYIPIFWTSYYIKKNYANDIDELYNWLDTLDKSKKYFTIVQYDYGIFVRNYDLNILVFSAGGGGLNIKNDTMTREVPFYGLKRYIFFGNKGDFDIPLICLPLFPSINTNKDIYCSFMGRFDTHSCRIEMKKCLENNPKFEFFESVNFDEYNKIINRSVFTLAPRGCGYTSFRIYEAIMGKSIPIYIWENTQILPFSDIINWNDIAIVINSSEIENLPQILENVNIIEKQNNISRVKEMFTFKYICNYIKTKIEKQRFISVTIPHYNNSNFICETINPLINDKRINEIIICDDKSSDIGELEKIILNYNNPKIKLFINDVNIGCYHNKINAVSKCTNDWAILLDSDNIYDSKCIDAIYSFGWNENTIYTPSYAITFPGYPSENMNYKKYSNSFITKQVYLNDFKNKTFQCLINTCNYFLPVKKFMNCMGTIQHTYKREIIDSLDSAVLFTDWLCNNNNIFVIDSLQYNHRLHDQSNFKISKAKPYNIFVLRILLNKIKKHCK
jgi:hypothetical protein